jgi:hypothetical protein
MTERKKVASKNIEGTTLSIDFENGEKLSISLNDLSSEIVEQLALHGLSQKVGDSYAGSGGDVAEAISLATAVVERLKNGEFKAKRESTGTTGRVTDLARALAQIVGVDLAEAVAKIDGMEKSEKTALRRHPQVAAVCADLAKQRAEERAAEATDVPDLASLLG